MNFASGVALLERTRYGGAKLQQLAQRIEQQISRGVYDEADRLAGEGFDEDLIAQAARDEIDRAMAAMDDGALLFDAIEMAREGLRRTVTSEYTAASSMAFGESLTRLVSGQPRA